MKTKFIILFTGSSLITSTALATNQTIINANNQAFINVQLGSGKLTYNNNRPADAGAPIFNSTTRTNGGELGITKTFGRIYSQVTLNSTRAVLDYYDSALNGTALTDGSSVSLNLAARIGYTFFSRENITFTPYVLGAYTNNQLDTGGYSANFMPVSYNGATLITQSFYYGIGLLNQWAISPIWVLNADLQLGTSNQASVSGYVNNFNNQPDAVTTYQHWNLSNASFWQIGVGSDYVATKNLHVKANATYSQHNLGGMNSGFRGDYPAQHHQNWMVSLGLGYGLSDINDPTGILTGGDQGTIYASNNQATLLLGYQTQQFHGGTSAAPFNSQTSSLPTLGLVFTKTWGHVYSQLGFNEGVSVTSNQTQNTALNAAGKLGYQFANSESSDITPYATLGYHRWLQNIAGTPSNQGSNNNIPTIYYINGVNGTYQHSWFGLGLLYQWAASPQLVLNADVGIGRTFNASLHSWQPISTPSYTNYSFNDANYQMLGLGADYLLQRYWHLQGNLGYWHYNYGASSVYTTGIAGLSASTKQWNATIGLGYSFG